MAAPPLLLDRSNQPFAFSRSNPRRQVAVGGPGPLDEPQRAQKMLAALAARRPSGLISK